jgi:ABC-2 type transport system ATP-binding protein
MSTAVEALGLVKCFGAIRAVDGVDLRVRPAEIRGLLGPNGAGKTTPLRLLFGLIRPERGYRYLSARHNLELLTRLDGLGACGRVGELLAERPSRCWPSRRAGARRA